MHQARYSRIAMLYRRVIPSALAFALLLTTIAFAPLALAQDEDTIVGEFGVTIVRSDIPTDQPDGYNYVGKWILSINDDGNYTASRQDLGLLVSGTWEVSGDQVTFTDIEGLVSCTNPTAVTIPGDDVSSGTYEWNRSGDDLQLNLVDDGCGGRVILMSTRTLTPYVPCLAEPIDDEVADVSGTPAAVEINPAASPEAIVEEVLTPDEPSGATRGTDTSTDEGSDATAVADANSVTTEIDELLAQMTACWSTGNPDLWLSLLTTDFREALIGSDPDFLTTIQAAMTVPIVWERAGDVEVDSPTTATAIVRTTVDQEQDFQRFLFAIEDDEWRWDG